MYQYHFPSTFQITYVITLPLLHKLAPDSLVRRLIRVIRLL